MTLMIGPSGKIRLIIAFLLQGFFTFQLVSCMYENVVKSTGSKPLGELQNSLKDLNDVSLDKLSLKEAEGPSSISELPETSHSQRAKTAIEINQEKISQLRAGYQDISNLVKQTTKRYTTEELGKFDLDSLLRIIESVNVLTNVRHQQLESEGSAQLKVLHQTELGHILFDADKSIRVAAKEIDSIYSNLISKSDPWSVIPLPIFTNVLNYLLKNHLIDLEHNFSVLQQPRVYELIGDIVWMRYAKLKDFNPFFLSLDFQNYVTSHPSMKDAHFILQALEPKAWRAVVGRFSNKLLEYYAPQSMLPHSSKINLENAIKSLHIEVPDINSLLDKFTGELSFESFSVSQDSFYNQKIYDRFVYHLFLFHILKTQIKGAPEEIARRANEEIRNFEKVLGLFVAKMDLIKAIGYMGINYNLRFNGSIMNSMKAMEVFLRNSDDSEVIENFYEIEGMMLKRYKPHYILQNLPAWRNRLISSAKDLDDVKIDYRNYMSTVGKSNDIIQQKWMNSDLLNEMRVEFETQINPENFALKLIKFINKWERELRYAENPNSIKS